MIEKTENTRHLIMDSFPLHLFSLFPTQALPYVEVGVFERETIPCRGMYPGSIVLGSICWSRFRTNLLSNAELVNTVASESLVVRSKFGAITNARSSARVLPRRYKNIPRLLAVIFVTATTSSRRKSWMKLITKSNTLRLRIGSCLTNSILSSIDLETAKQVLYSLVGMMGDSSSRNHSLNSEAATCGSSIPDYIISLLSRVINEQLTS